MKESQIVNPDNPNYATDLLLKTVGEFVRDGGDLNEVDLSQFCTELEVLFPEFDREKVKWDAWPDQMVRTFQQIKWDERLNKN